MLPPPTIMAEHAVKNIKIKAVISNRMHSLRGQRVCTAIVPLSATLAYRQPVDYGPLLIFAHQGPAADLVQRPMATQATIIVVQRTGGIARGWGAAIAVQIG